ncbi:type VI secretion system-associated FHA domain protein TagH [Stakelama marina]|uniref:Type VI secretion system-associated FHA domain protein TagH n=1 Tax=Stakelama marina TaxID=2826939 RepID=A0A8T4IFU7_9SPHN|nr:type VI secretion system-associated FHA domain protein TagH [Stakelama marina]MBR0553321.1 type VI secretion system-associated FHA domain protein TagH [Stakelama marina]
MYVFRLFDQADPLHPLDARMIREGLLRVGRDPGSDWVLVDPECELSRAHCEFEANDDALTICSLGANGVFDDATDTRLPEHERVTLSLPQTLRLGKYRLVAERAADTELDEASANSTMVFQPPLGDSIEVPADWADGAATLSSQPMEEGSLLEAFCEGAGLDASVFSTEEPTEIMRRAGAVYRQMVLGVGDLMAERDRARAQFRLARTTIGGDGNNPFKWAPTQRLAIDLLLAGEASFLSGPAALKASFRDVKKHLVATFGGFRASLRAAVAHFDPEAVEQEARKKKGGLLKSRDAAAWEEARKRHAELAQQIEQCEDGLLNRAFVEAYGKAANTAETIS